MSGRVGIGVVGAGSIGIRGALEHLCLPDVQDVVSLATVCDPVPGRAKAAAEKYRVARAYESYDDLLADDQVHAVTLCSPIGLHFEQGLAAIRAGKHIHFNKTMTVTAAEATTLIEEAAKRDVKLVASPGQILFPVHRAIRRLILDGAIGKIAWAATGAAFGDYHEKEGLRTGEDVLTNINPSWYWRKPGGGPLYDMTVYGLHALTGVLGPAKRISGFSAVAIPEREFRGQKYPCDADDNSLFVLDFGEGVFAFIFGTHAGMPFTFGHPNYYGSKGAITGILLNGEPVDFPGRQETRIEPYGDVDLLPYVTGKHREMGERHVYADVMQLVRWIREGIPSGATAEHARHVIEIIEAGYRAAETGQAQDLTTTFNPPDVSKS
ncbi:MAG: gfo/Idh/MocA family oxidoreductase [Puniceicoccaceae bacterium]|nr:MAG: gfo/Idh/MocA family oxidoreductase [Puniceicoccaceae bacterium]